MTIRRLTVLLVTALAALPLGGAHAALDCSVGVDEASATNAHIVDETGDWDGYVSGNQGGGYGDAYGEGIDLKAAWIARSAEGTLQGHIQVVQLSALQPNSIFYLVWTFEGGDAKRQQRWVSARLKGYAMAFTFGYHSGATLPAGTSGTFVTVGSTTGAIVEGADGELVIDLPKGGTAVDPSNNQTVSTDAWGNPGPGAVLSFEPTGTTIPFGAESRFLLGSPEPLPPNPAGLRHGLVSPLDLSDNATTLCDATIPSA